VNEEQYVALVREVEDIIRAHADRMTPEDLTSHDQDLWNMTGLSISLLLWQDLLGKVPLPDETVMRLWEIGYALGYEADFLVSKEGLAKARDGRRTRPAEPVRFPLKGGGHGAGRGLSGKVEYPARWSDDEAIEHVMSVAREPDGAIRQPDGTFRAWGTRDNVDLRVIVTELGDVVTAYPIGGDGIVTNPLDDVRRPYVERLQAVIDGTPMDNEAAQGVTELMRVGEWDQVLLHLRALPVPDREELQQLCEAAGITTPG
jgi:hypothetical protein